MYEWSDLQRVDQDDGSITYEGHGNEDPDDERDSNTFICVEGVRAKDVADIIYAALNWYPMETLPKEGTVLVKWDKEQRYPPSGSVQACFIKDGKPFYVGSAFAFDYDPPVGWRPIL